MTSHPAFRVGGFSSFSCCAESVREPPISSSRVPVTVGWAAGRRTHNGSNAEGSAGCLPSQGESRATHGRARQHESGERRPNLPKAGSTPARSILPRQSRIHSGQRSESEGAGSSNRLCGLEPVSAAQPASFGGTT